MEYKCDLITDEIWERARAGETLPAGAVEHIDECPKCRRAADEVRNIVSMVRLTASCVPPAPDCRSAVMERISPRPVWRSAWAYAAASVLLAAVIVAGWLAMHSGAEQSPIAVRDSKPEIQERVAKPDITPSVQPESTHEIRQETPKQAPVVVNPPKIERPKRMHFLPKQRPTRLVKHTPRTELTRHEIPAGLEPEQVVTFDDEPVAAVAVSWPTVGDPVMPASYGYTNRDVSTGEVTFCSVERSDNAITIHLESNAPGELPGKGA